MVQQVQRVLPDQPDLQVWMAIDTIQKQQRL
jgi:hypothetical protein